MRRRLSNFIAPLTVNSVRAHVVGERSDHHHHDHGHHHRQLESAVKGNHLQQCQIVTVVGGATNVFFSLTKMWVGTRGGSVALVADGFHALVDLLADVISYVTLTLSVKRLPRCRFPFGIGRIETAGAVVVAFTLLLGGLTLLFQSLGECQREFLHRIPGNDNANYPHEHVHQNYSHSDDGEKQPDVVGVQNHHGHSHFQVTQLDEDGRVTILWTMVLVSIVSIIAKEFLFQWTKRVGERAGSRVVVANAYHHRADAWSGAVALVGVGGHCVGMPGIDGLAGLCVSYSICRMGYSLLRSSLLEFFDFQCANEVASVRHALKQYKKTPFVNAFLIRHGHSYALHVTLLVEAEMTASSVVAVASELTALAKQSVAVRDTYATLFIYEKDKEASLHEALEMVREFHGLEPIKCRWEAKEIITQQSLCGECIEDINTVASAFSAVVIRSEGNSQSSKRNGTCHR
ncbi:putative cation transporter [Trypanosoma cruzi]|uniref:Cation transporter, putative n=2 Tax=Trypanosoma cruzi TaxID=5693 RepID=Q4D0I2_TRYCC|nr:cation transporter, putative [Trypanosoma cruzi]EAN86033.1 cation transporter, putative [Trypanosoma cruzi]KAF5223772.1 hypothetical protein ECC02_003226 [Trypanosoma cruzi]KAF8292681.1 putative cation transporter [Trypanosoma cruzi]PWV00002.1 putative cation transporter [Trypanosoma cruzi]RNC56660.1 putative cation transporter [Trypanosoma cruzi]|eukprot:XP_807884.1 cation transporter [Trypanosoma cruzi strain CL Brener]